jgi:phosphatidate cytidylyltransferase
MRRRRSVAEAKAIQPAAPVKRTTSPGKPLQPAALHSLQSNSSLSSSTSFSDGDVHTAESASDTPLASIHVQDAPPAKRWQDWWVRVAMTGLMIGGCFAYVYTLRQAGVVLLIFALQTGIYRELVRIATVDGQERALPGFSYFYWYWFFVCTFFIYTWTLQPYLLSGLTGVPLFRPAQVIHLAGKGAMHKAYTAPQLQINGSMEDLFIAAVSAGNMARKAALFIIKEYVLIAFSLYCAGLIAFVFSLRRRKNFKYQFSQFAYCHIALLAVVFQSTFLCSLVFNGLIWFFLPCGTVVCNDSMAYVAGTSRLTRVPSLYFIFAGSWHDLTRTFSQGFSSDGHPLSASLPRRLWRVLLEAHLPRLCSLCSQRACGKAQKPSTQSI